MNNALIGATIMYFDDKNNEIISNRSDTNGKLLLKKDFKYLSVWLIGFQKSFYNSNDLQKDTNIIIVKSVRYVCPDLIIKKDGKFIIDCSLYIDKFADKEIYYDENCPYDSIQENDGRILIEIGDTIRKQMDCKIAVPKFGGFIHYYDGLADQISQLKQANCFDSGLIIVNFSVDRLGVMRINNIEGVKSEYQEIFKNKINDYWIPAKMWDRRMKTDYRMKIKME